MDKKKLIVRRLLEWSDTIARKNWYEMPSHDTFRNWARRDSVATDEDLTLAAKSEKYLKVPFAFLIACQFDLGKPAWKAWRAPFLIKQKMKNLTVGKVLGTDVRRLKNIIADQGLGCRNLPAAKAAINLKSLCTIIKTEYGGKAHNIWKKPSSIKDLEETLRRLPGFGTGLTFMTIKIMLSLGMLSHMKKDKNSKMGLNVKPDVHVKRVFYRTGLIENMKESSALKGAGDLYPKFPMLLDSAFYIGTQFCNAKRPACTDCPLSQKSNGEDLCMRRLA